MTDWTPGPWRMEWQTPNMGNENATIALVGDYRVTASTPDYEVHGPDKVDARLIAAAPELYEALEAIVGALLDQDHVGALQIARTAGRAALAKARGET